MHDPSDRTGVYCSRRQILVRSRIRSVVVTRLAELPVPNGSIFIVNDPVPMENFVRAAAEALGVPPPTRTMPVWLAYAAAAGLQVGHRLLGTPAPLTISRVKALATRTWFSADCLKAKAGVSLSFGYRHGLQRTVQWHRSQGHAL